jgi:hypothetical protein
MSAVFVLIEEHGESEQFTRTVLGVFSSEDAARAAIPKFEELGKIQFADYQDHQKRREEYLTRFEPAKIYPAASPTNNSPFPCDCILYTNDQYKEADEALGKPPAIICKGDNYEIECFNIDAIEAH